MMSVTEVLKSELLDKDSQENTKTTVKTLTAEEVDAELYQLILLFNKPNKH